MTTPDDAPSARARGSATKVAALVIGALVALGIGGAVAQLAQPPSSAPRTSPLPSRSTPTTSPPALRTTPDPDEQRVMALQALLAVRTRAVLEHDRQAWLSTLDPQGTTFRGRQSVVFDNLSEVPFSEYAYEFAGVAPPLSAGRLRQLGPTAWVARVVSGYRVEGFDRTSSQTEKYLTCVLRDGRWYLTADTDGNSVPQPWDLGHVHVVRADRVLVMGTADISTLRSYAAQGDKAIARVSKVWGKAWPRRAVLLVPRSQDEMSKLLQRTDGLDQIAAVTTGELSGGGSGAAGSDRVVINPTAFSRLGAAGRRVVLTHELTHVAVRSSTSTAVPIWLSEGFADYVGYQGVGLGRRTVAADVLALVRRGEGFRQLPTVDDFDPARTTIAPAYSAAWLACSLISDRYGRNGLVRLYRTAATTRGSDPDSALAQAFASTLGTSKGAFTRSWLDYLARLAAA